MGYNNALTEQDMPILIPIPIQTAGSGYFKRIFSWLFKSRQYKLDENWYFKLPDSTKICIPKGFIFDGASIPRPFWWLLSPSGIMLIPGLIHDFNYTYAYSIILNEDGSFFKKEMTQKDADKLFKEVGIEINGLKVIANIAWFALVIFGCIAWKRHKKDGTHGKDIELLLDK